MQADGGFIEDKDRIRLTFPHLTGQLQTLGFAAGEAWRLLAQGQIAQPQLFQNLQALMNSLQIFRGLQRRMHIHFHKLRQGILLS